MSNRKDDLTIIEIEQKEGIIIYKSDVNTDYPLTSWYSVIRDKHISELTDADVARAIRQELFLDYTVSEALKRLRKDPTIGGKYYGEVLVAIFKVGEAFWKDNPDIAQETLNLLSELNSGQLLPKGFEWTYDGEEQEFNKKAELLYEKLNKIYNQQVGGR